MDYPEAQLRLEWVYGYRGHQCRNNIHITSQGDVVYFVAGVAVIMSLDAQSQRFYLQHDDDIISMAMHNDEATVATGQVGHNPAIRIWDAVTLETVSILHGAHQRGVGAVVFSSANHQQRLASIGLEDDHRVAVWDWKHGTLLATCAGHSERVGIIQ
eukprot:m.296054 g.296054  ORF g.296054 m.296054 type:complete len:157 (+) comp65081_c0_seq1:46-516(+)